MLSANREKKLRTIQISLVFPLFSDQIAQRTMLELIICPIQKNCLCFFFSLVCDKFCWAEINQANSNGRGRVRKGFSFSVNELRIQRDNKTNNERKKTAISHPFERSSRLWLKFSKRNCVCFVYTKQCFVEAQMQRHNNKKNSKCND